MNLLVLSGDIALAQGRESVFHDMLRHFSQHWTRIDILCPRAPGSAPRTVHGNVFVYPSPRHKALQARYVVRTASTLFGERTYDLIVSHDYGLFFNGMAARRLSRRFGVPYVSEIHHVEGYPRAANFREAVSRGLTKTYIRWTWPHAAAIRAVNQIEVPELLRRLRVPDEKILVLPSVYLDLEVFGPMPQEPKRFDALFVGRLVPNKGISTILHAFARVRDVRPGARLAILGEGPLRAAIDRQISRLGLREHVTLIDRLPSARDLAALYNRSRTLVCASTGEGGPRVAFEAMACGIPVVTTPVGMMREVIQDGENGLLFEWSAAELADKLNGLLADDALRTRLGEAGRQSVYAFKADASVERLASGYKTLVLRTKTTSASLN